SPIMDKSSKNPEEDRVSLQSDGKVQTNGVVKEALGMLQSFKQSMRRPTEKSPCSAKSKDSKVREKAQANGSESVSSPPQPSPKGSDHWDPAERFFKVDFQSLQEMMRTYSTVQMF
ncbi:hypothetical protein ATANTOWER_004751, partial [Ataeniobius toweri]|nr:hypothetical protein [Ataeniobius toweri]